MKNPSTIPFATAAQAHARINQLEATLGVPLSAEDPMIDRAWEKIEQLEGELAAKSDSSAQPAAQAKPVAAPPAKSAALPVDPDLRGIERAAQAQRDGRTEKPTPPASMVPKTGWGRAAAAQEVLNRRNS